MRRQTERSWRTVEHKAKTVDTRSHRPIYHNEVYQTYRQKNTTSAVDCLLHIQFRDANLDYHVGGLIKLTLLSCQEYS
ncbi:hypothetical protein D3C78_46680 [compost metagenome]